MSSESAVFRAVADETRREILRLLSSARRPVSDLAARFPSMSRPAVSKHLRILRQAGLVSESRDGRLRLYRLEPEALETIGRWLAQVEPHALLDAVEPVRLRSSGATPRRRGERRPSVRPLRRDQPDLDDWRAW